MSCHFKCTGSFHVFCPIDEYVQLTNMLQFCAGSAQFQQLVIIFQESMMAWCFCEVLEGVMCTSNECTFGIAVCLVTRFYNFFSTFLEPLCL